MNNIITFPTVLKTEDERNKWEKGEYLPSYYNAQICNINIQTRTNLDREYIFTVDNNSDKYVNRYGAIIPKVKWINGFSYATLVFYNQILNQYGSNYREHPLYTVEINSTKNPDNTSQIIYNDILSAVKLSYKRIYETFKNLKYENKWI